MTQDLSLVADIGGTYARFALAAGGQADLAGARKYPVEDFPGPEEAAERFLADLGAPNHGAGRPKRFCLAVAGPVTGVRSQITNSPWMIDRDALTRRFDLTDCRVINDFAALAWALPHLSEAGLARLGQHGSVGRGSRVLPGPRAVLGPGTGLGVACLAQDGKTTLALPTEGGHVGFAPANLREIEVLKILLATHPRVSAERVLSGPGLEVLHQTLGEVGGTQQAWMSARQIVEAAASRQGPCWDTVQTFAGMLGSFAGDVALMIGARGGVYLGGGLVGHLAPMLEETPFRQRFEEKGRMADFVRAIPTFIITGRLAALVGAAACLENPSD
ncbi:MAG: glucokinase [Alphaproteobacteria bacterium]